MNLIDNSISEQLAINCKFTIYEQRRGAEIEKKGNVNDKCPL